MTPPLPAGYYPIGAAHPDHGKVLYKSNGSSVDARAKCANGTCVDAANVKPATSETAKYSEGGRIDY